MQIENNMLRKLDDCFHITVKKEMKKLKIEDCFIRTTSSQPDFGFKIGSDLKKKLYEYFL